MTRVFLDTSALVALAFAEAGNDEIATALAAADAVHASTLLEAEFTALRES